MKKLGTGLVLITATIASIILASLGASNATALPRYGESALYVTTENPTPEQLGAQMAALNNPDVATQPKLENIYGANGQYRPAIEAWFRIIAATNQGEVTYQLGTVQRNGNTITMNVKSTAKGMGSYDETFYWQRESGRWKYDVISWCKTSNSCPGKDLVK